MVQRYIKWYQKGPKLSKKGFKNGPKLTKGPEKDQNGLKNIQ